jgi:hypothetical protein
MTDGTYALQPFGPKHALSLRGLHLRESSGAWELVVPMPPELIAPVRTLCERLTTGKAAEVLGLLERYLRADLERLLSLQERQVPSCR